MPSAIAQSNIFPGAAVTQSNDKATLAGGGLLATHIVSIGARMKGVVPLIANGQVFLDDWTLATGSKTLTPGVTYYVSTSGTLATSGMQPVGIAVSKNTLSVTIQNQGQSSSTAAASSNITALQVQVAALAAQMINLMAVSPKQVASTASIGNGVNSGTVTGQGIIAFTPTKVISTVRKPSGGLNIYSTVIDTTITQDGFQYVLSSLTDSANYKLDFIMLP